MTNQALNKHNIPRATFGNPDNRLKLGDRELECYVLEDGTRVLSGSGMQNALGFPGNSGTHLQTFLKQKVIQEMLSIDLKNELFSPRKFIRPGRGGRRAFAYEATILPRLCDSILEARKHGFLTSARQKKIAEQCEIIVRVLSKVGIIALVDEITGYQKVCDRDALQQVLDKYLTDEWAKWTKTFPDEFYRELFRLKGIEYPLRSGKRASYVGHWTNDVVYDRLVPGLKEELKKKNPVTDKGYREHKHHQHLTREIGHPKLKEYLTQIIFLMKACSTYRDFSCRLARVAPKYNETMELSM